MKELQLAQNYKTLVDDEDFEFLDQWKWRTVPAKSNQNKFYVMRFINKDGKKKTISMHRMIMNVSDPKIKIDHIDGNGLNNQKSNLRICTMAENSRNAAKGNREKPSTSKYKGVCWDKDNNLWRARIRLDYKLIVIGRYKKEEDAALAYDLKAIELFGEFALLNFKDSIGKSMPLTSKEERKTSKYKGVSLKGKSKAWIAFIRLNGKSKYIGYFKNEIDAALAHDKAIIEFEQDKSKLNFID